MRNRCWWWSLAFVVGVAGAGGAQVPAGLVAVRIETALGTIDIAIDSARAPVTATNFLKYVDAGHYDGGRFHRTVTPANQASNPVKIEVIQGSVARERGAAGFGAIMLERTNATGITHVDGTISMARVGPNTATSDFFICIGPQPELDFGGKRNVDGQGFAAFGRVTAGMDVVRRIQASPAQGQSLTPPISIQRVTRVK